MDIKEVKNLMADKLIEYGFIYDDKPLNERGKVLSNVYKYDEIDLSVIFILNKSGDNNALTIKAYQDDKVISLLDDWVDIYLGQKADADFIRNYIYSIVEKIRQSFKRSDIDV